MPDISIHDDVDDDSEMPLPMLPSAAMSGSSDIPPTPLPPYVISPNTMAEDVARIMEQVAI